jgi:hypothetical protein
MVVPRRQPIAASLVLERQALIGHEVERRGDRRAGDVQRLGNLGDVERRPDFQPLVEDELADAVRDLLLQSVSAAPDLRRLLRWRCGATPAWMVTPPQGFDSTCANSA